MTVVVRHTLAREQGCQYVTLECSVGFLKSLAEPDTHKVDTLLAPDDSTGAETRVLDGVTYLELELWGFTLSTLSRHIHHLESLAHAHADGSTQARPLKDTLRIAVTSFARFGSDFGCRSRMY
jgi:hypothetical protein